MAKKSAWTTPRKGGGAWKTGAQDDHAQEEEDKTSLCTYKFGKCLNPRTRKINGTLHSLCSMHRMRQNAHQLKSDRKRREKQRTTDSGASSSSSEPMSSTSTIVDNALLLSLKHDVETLIRLVKTVLNQSPNANVDTCWSLLSLHEQRPTPQEPQSFLELHTDGQSPDDVLHFSTAPFEWPALQLPLDKPAEAQGQLPSLLDLSRSPHETAI
ncbi:hypothetical protein SPRG_08210 [Saprolegnia parasitica CBS 223.65]|uniref:Uncharacterized protein n=1 Tax=Saprolegnia parasitica (strain CBS 223.65) TaxID=695850 RepID=A0A067CHW7_SAPPC|nr:hypothetical protein SPRG_08210 [Saprolegnia parasitica CBS 223.65]KDO26407.1 hypothetical protein SPRG_08210 [Saprolegnia parasitica CBS 223.65]|eukprot:XP_012202844.1 hypothetical protein SPRG_08210 [Saprolegnia parasitica CBS 223.65]